MGEWTHMGQILLGSGKWIPALLFVCGAVLIAAAVVTEEAEVSLFIIFPVFSGSSWMFVLGVLFIIAGFVAFFLTMVDAASRNAPSEGHGPDLDGLGRKTRRYYGGVVMIGPVPIAFGSDTKIAKIMLVIGVVLVVFFIWLFVVSPFL